ALTPTDASAWGFRGGFHGGGFHGIGFRGGFHGGYRFGGFGFRHGFYHCCGYGGWGGYHRAYWWPHQPWRWWRYPRPIVYGAVGGGAVAAAVSAPAQPAPQAQPNCLVKQYLPNGAVAFQDVCTNESAVSAGAEPQGGPQGGPQGAPR
ncbi:MAG TPA: hypothetical protein VGH49_14340, partial [Xanthobacteraceae bacterium]